MNNSPSPQLHNALVFVAVANLIYFAAEFLAGLKGGSVSLFADSIDFFEDASLNFLILIGLNWTPKARAHLGRVLACVLIVPALSFIWAAISKFSTHAIPDAEVLTMVGGGAFLVNATCALMLVSVRCEGGSLTKAAFLSARNDLLANIAIIAAGGITAYLHSFWPDLLVGFAIAAMNLDAAKAVWSAAQQELRDARP
jgi:Co/Zn/Cd efflux system component